MIGDPETTRIVGRKPPVARWLNIVLGAWLFATAWLWPMPDPARANAMIVGISITAVALIAMFMPALRRLNTLLAMWLFVSAAAVFRDVPSVVTWNNIVVAVAVIILSLPPDYARRESVDQPYVRRWARHRAR